MGEITSYPNLGTAPASADEFYLVHSGGSYNVSWAQMLSGVPSGGAGGQSGLFNVVTGYGADNTGTTDVTSAFQAAWNAAQAAGGGVIYIPRGTYKRAGSTSIGGDCNGAPIYWVGPGCGVATIMDYGSGDLFRQYDSTNITTRTKDGGGILGITIDGTNTTGSGGAIRLGDISRLQWDVIVQKYGYDANSYGFRMDNQYYWSEQQLGTITAVECANHHIFESSANVSGSATGSFERSNLRLFVIQAGTGNGLVLRNGADGTGADFYYGGNFDCSTGTVYSAISVDATSSFFGRMHLDIEQDSTSGTAPMTIDIASGGAFAGFGMLNFGTGSGSDVAWTATNGTSSNFLSPYCNYIVFGDATLAGFCKTSWAANT